MLRGVVTAVVTTAVARSWVVAEQERAPRVRTGTRQGQGRLSPAEELGVEPDGLGQGARWQLRSGDTEQGAPASRSASGAEALLTCL